jgi:hypothetical protein
MAGVLSHALAFCDGRDATRKLPEHRRFFVEVASERVDVGRAIQVLNVVKAPPRMADRRGTGYRTTVRQSAARPSSGSVEVEVAHVELRVMLATLLLFALHRFRNERNFMLS